MLQKHTYFATGWTVFQGITFSLLFREQRKINLFILPFSVSLSAFVQRSNDLASLCYFFNVLHDLWKIRIKMFSPSQFFFICTTVNTSLFTHVHPPLLFVKS